MGISGLLPLLKSIQVNRHLSEFSGQTLAVDAYVWLHRGVYACATEVATGKPTTKYVEYAMNRVRLLRHFKIEPYIVFDGGPLPAKRGTESERKRKRDENLAEAKRLTAQGRHSQAREYYVRCLDVTPEMAYQLIKALRAESVQYVVAPYEADAQLAYLERIGLVDGIITEDSDLLVFGCRNVLFKLDTVASTVVSISRSDFGSIAAVDNGISLIGWSDTQFRSMAILSGCDYLSSIPGVGLKTAWSLLRKHKTAEKAIRSLQLEGKKEVPSNYISSFKLVEKVFLHQRVYDPVKERLVYLTDVLDGETLNDIQDAYIGEDLDPVLAKKVALGDYCPTMLIPIVDVNPGFVPRALKPLPFLLNGADSKGNEKGVEKVTSQGILSFFESKARPTTRTKNHPQPDNNDKVATNVGRASGKRRLSDLMDVDITAGTNRHDENGRPVKRPIIIHSKFFDHSRHVTNAATFLAIPLRRPPPVPLPKDIALKIDDVDLSESDSITQEDGYISPAPSFRRFETPDLPSPSRSPKAPRASRSTEDDEFGADVLSSPAAKLVPSDRIIKTNSWSTLLATREEYDRDYPDIDNEDQGLDLQGAFGEELTSEIDCPEPENSFSSTSTSSSSGLLTPNESRNGPSDKEEELVLNEADEAVSVNNIRAKNVATGWMKRWAYGAESRTHLRRMETTITLEGRNRPRSLTSLRGASITRQTEMTPSLRKRFVHIDKQGVTGDRRRDKAGEKSDGPRPAGSDEMEDIVSRTKERLGQFRTV